MKFVQFFVILLLILFTTGCQNSTSKGSSMSSGNSHEFTLLQKDSVMTRELILKILQEEEQDYFLSTCISVEKGIIEMPLRPDMEEFLQEKLQILQVAHLKQQMDLRNNFSLSPTLAPGKRILTAEEINSFKNNPAGATPSFSDWLLGNCSNGYGAISKPVFNENFDLALVQIANYCNLCCCGSGETRTYEYREGKWRLKETLISWLS